MNDVGSWLKDVGLERYAATFVREAIEWDDLFDLSEPDLAALGIPLGHRKRLLRAIEQLQSTAVAEGHLSERRGPGQLPRPERRQLTVMFCDLVGSTALARQLDPEEVRPIIRAYQDCCAGIVARLDGVIGNYIGDGVLSYFGHPRAHEDDAERALRAAMDIIPAVRRLSSGNGTRLQTRIAVTTGLVVVGDLIGTGRAREVELVGEPLNIAARLQSLAAPDGIVVDKATRDLTAGLFTFADLGGHALKGVSETVRVWALTGETALPTRFEATRGGRIVPFVDRNSELTTLIAAWELVNQGVGQLVLLGGDPGIGKSRLVQVFENSLGGQPHSKLLLQSSPHHQSTALHPIVQHVRGAAGLTSDDTPQQKLDKLAAYCADAAEIGEALSLYASLLSIPEDESPVEFTGQSGTKEHAFKVFLREFDRLSAQSPLLVVVEDAQWLDPTSFELLEAVAERVHDRRALVIVTYRSDFALPLAERRQSVRVQLARLPRPDCQTMVEHLAARKTVPPAVLTEIVARADGVALFVEELTKAVLESDILVDVGDRYEMRAATPARAIPATLNGSLMARLDRDPATRETAQIGSVIGREFTADMLGAVAQQPQARLRQALARLVEAELLEHVDGAAQPTFRFKHALVQDAAYESLLLSRRRTLHLRLAEVIESRFPDTVASEPAVLAHHFRRAGAPERAISYCIRAARLAIARSAMAEALTESQVGLDLLPDLPPGADARRLELELQVLRGHALRAARAPSASETGQAWDRARSLCVGGDDIRYLRQVLYGQFLFHQGNANLSRARQLGEELLALDEQRPNLNARVRGHSAVGRTAFGQGDFAAAQFHLEQALAIPDRMFREARDSLDRPESPVLNLCYLAWALFVQGHVTRASERCAELIAVANRLSRPYDVVVAWGNACYTHQFRRDLKAVADSANVVIDLAGERGFPAWLSLGRLFRGWALTQAGDVVAGVQLIEQALADHRATGERLEVPYFLGLLAECYAKSGRPEAALEALAEGIAMTASTGETWCEAELHRIRGELHLRASPAGTTEAIKCFHRAIEVARAQGARMWELRAAISLARQLSGAAAVNELLQPILSSFGDEPGVAELEEARRIVG